MRCVLCRHSETRPGTTDKTFSHEGRTLLIRDVPAEICHSCGGRFFAAEVTDKLLTLARAAAATGGMVDLRYHGA